MEDLSDAGLESLDFASPTLWNLNPQILTTLLPLGKVSLSLL